MYPPPCRFCHIPKVRIALCRPFDDILTLSIGGMDLNPVFTSPFKFNPSGDGKELKLFDQTNMKLVHGWLVDPDSAEAEAITSAQDYDNATILIVEADHLANGQLVLKENDSFPQAGSSSRPSPSNGHTAWTGDQRKKVEEGQTMCLNAESDADCLSFSGSNKTFPGYLLVAIHIPRSIYPLGRPRARLPGGPVSLLAPICTI